MDPIANVGEIECLGKLNAREGYATSCACKDRNHSVSIEIEFDKKTKQVYLSLEQNMYLKDYWSYFNGFQSFWKRIKTALGVIFKGEVEVEGSFIFRDPKHIRAFASILNSAADRSEKEFDESLTVITI